MERLNLRRSECLNLWRSERLNLGRTQELKGYLINRGYNEDEIQRQIDRTAGLDREALLCCKGTKTPLERVPLIVPIIQVSLPLNAF